MSTPGVIFCRITDVIGVAIMITVDFLNLMNVQMLFE